MGHKGGHLQFQTLTIVSLSDNERISQTIATENAAIAVTALHRDGIVCLSNAVDLAHICALYDSLAAEVDVVAKLPTTYWNNNSADGSPTGNMAQGPPLTPELMFSDVWANGPALAVMSSVMGPNPRVNFVGGNTNLAGFNGARQNVHPDLTFNHGLFPFAFCSNYGLSDMSMENGTTELWLGSHRDTSYADHQPQIQKDGEPASRFAIKTSLLDERRRYAPPIQPFIPKGSVVIRDLRLWHAGLPNPSPDPRMMLAFVHTAWWYQCPGKVVFPELARSLVEQWSKQKHAVDYNAYFVPEEVDHKSVAFTPDFDSGNAAYQGLLPNIPKAGTNEP